MNGMDTDKNFVRKMVAKGGDEGHPGMPLNWLPGAAIPAFQALVAEGDIKILKVTKEGAGGTRTYQYAVLVERHNVFPRNDFDEVDHVAEIVGRRAVYTTYEGDHMVGVVEAATRHSSGYPVIRFEDGRWGRADADVELVVE